MAKDPDAAKTKQSEQFWLSAKLARRRFIASQALRSGKAEQLRKKALEEGEVPWRILRYVRVVDPKKIPVPVYYGSYVTPKTFERHLQYLQNECKPLVLAELLTLIARKEPIPDRAVVVTFDGGHTDAYVNAFPLLVKYEIPAAFFIPATHVGTNSFFFSDRIYMALRFMEKAGMPLLDLSFLDDQFREQKKKVAPNWEINDESIALYLAALERASHKNRIVTLEVYGTVLKDIFTLPPYEDFVRWDDLRQMLKHGITFGPMSNGHHLATQMTPQAFLEDYALEFKTFKEQNIPLEPVFCFREGVFTPESIMVLRDAGVQFALTAGPAPAPDELPIQPALLGRVRFAEEDSFCTELFACRLWGVELNGIQF